MSAGTTRQMLLCAALILRPNANGQVAQTPAQPEVPSFKSSVNVVVIPVLVRDAQGHEVGDLRQEDFRVFDNGKPQIISGFSVEKRAKAAPDSKRFDPASADAGAVPQRAPVAPRFIVFMFDDLHLSAGDLAQTQKAATVLAGALAESDMAAAVSISGVVNSGLTTDRAKLQEAIMKLRPQGVYRAAGAECPELDYYQADLIANKHNSMALESAIEQVLSCMPNLDSRNVAERMAEGAAARVINLGDQDVRVSLSSLREFTRRMGGLPGQRTLILVSPGFLIISPEARREESEIMDLAAQSNVTISALDARGLYTTELDASERGTGSELITRMKSEYHRNTSNSNENVMAELADGTGGTYFHNSNDLKGGLSALTEAPEYMYLLYVSPQKLKHDGSYHSLKVRVYQKGLRVQARRGYVAPSKGKTK